MPLTKALERLAGAVGQTVTSTNPVKSSKTSTAGRST